MNDDFYKIIQKFAKISVKFKKNTQKRFLKAIKYKQIEKVNKFLE